MEISKMTQIFHMWKDKYNIYFRETMLDLSLPEIKKIINKYQKYSDVGEKKNRTQDRVDSAMAELGSAPC